MAALTACSPRHEYDVLGPKLWRKLQPLPLEAVGPQWRLSARRGEREAERSTRRAGKAGTCRQSRDGHVAATRGGGGERRWGVGPWDGRAQPGVGWVWNARLGS